MNLSAIKAGIKRNWTDSIPVARKYNIPTPVIYVDRLCSKLFHGVNLSQEYDWFGVYRLNRRERKNLFTTGRCFKTYDMFFTPEVRAAVASKKGFAQSFSEFTGREILLLPCGTGELLSFTERHGAAFFKENISNSGKGVHRYSHDELARERGLLERLASMDGVAEEPIGQHPRMAELNPRAVSTLRISTMVEKDGTVNIFGTALRIGRGDTCVDNLGSGGFGFQVDSETGIVVGYGRDYQYNKTLKSPTGIVMPGFCIPCWDDVLRLVRTAAAKFPQARLMGWDVAITPDGPVLVEANASTGPSVTQFDEGGCWNYIKSQK